MNVQHCMTARTTREPNTGMKTSAMPVARSTKKNPYQLLLINPSRKQMPKLLSTLALDLFVRTLLPLRMYSIVNVNHLSKIRYKTDPTTRHNKDTTRLLLQIPL